MIRGAPTSMNLLLALALCLLGGVNSPAHSEEMDAGHLISEAQARLACGSEFRLDAPGAPLEFVAHHNQGPVPNCFAHTAATLYDAWGLSHPAPLGYFNREHRSSPYWSSIQEPGHPTNILDALRWLRSNGSCDRKAYSALPTWLYEKEFNQNYDALNAIWKEAQHKSDDEIMMLAGEFNRRVGFNIFAPDALPEVSDVFAALKAPSTTEAIAMIYHSLCRSSDVYEKLPIPMPIEKQLLGEGDDPELFIRQTWSQESANRQPLGLGFCSSAFKDPYISVPRGHMNGWEGCDPHAVVLMGRRWSEERHQCEYLIRNSWGNSCSYYDASAVVECEAKTTQVWVSSDWVGRSVFAVVHLPGK